MSHQLLCRSSIFVEVMIFLYIKLSVVGNVRVDTDELLSGLTNKKGLKQLKQKLVKQNSSRNVSLDIISEKN